MNVHPKWRDLASLPPKHLRCPSCGLVRHHAAFQWVPAPGVTEAERIAAFPPDGGRWQYASDPPGQEQRQNLQLRVLDQAGESEVWKFIQTVPYDRLPEVEQAIVNGIEAGKALIAGRGQGWSQDWKDDAIRRTIHRYVKAALREVMADGDGEGVA